MQYEILVYENAQGIRPYQKWLEKMRNPQALVQIQKRIQRMANGNFGDCKALGSGLWELRIDCGPGYRIYYAVYGNKIIVLFAGGDKSTQAEDIARSQQFKKDYEVK